jgi:hypothetical protein
VPPKNRSAEQSFAFALALVALAALFTSAAYLPPASRPADIAPTEFSGARAQALLGELLGDGGPHPGGSAADAAVRQRIVAILTRFGYQPTIQTGFACDDWGACASVQNVLARLDGTDPGEAVLLASHYDSVPAGPGATDDGVGVAVNLEVARILKLRGPGRHSIIFLLDEGEEQGLLGAHAFVESNPWAKEVRAAVNIDSRGTSGASLMFETGSANNWLVQTFARAVPHPMTSSIYYAVYKLLPNETDFSVFRLFGYQGFDFANIGDVPRYHTSLDNFENAEARTIQHQGENALDTTVALANAPLDNPPAGEAVFFDVLGRGVIHWPQRWTLGISLAAALLLFAEFALLIFSERLVMREILWGLGVCFATVLQAAAFSVLVFRMLKLANALPGDWIAHPWAAEAGFVSVAFAALAVTLRWAGPRTGFWGIWVGAWFWWLLAAVVLAWTVPGFSHIFVAGTMVAALAGVPPALAKDGSSPWRLAAALVPATAAAIVMFGCVWNLYAAIGVLAFPALTVALALVLILFAPVFCEADQGAPAVFGGFLAVCTGAALVFATGAILLPAYSAASPDRMNISYSLDADSRKAQWLVEAESEQLPAAFRQVMQFNATPEKPFPWSATPAFMADAGHIDLAAPALTIEDVTVSGRKRIVHAQLKSLRGAPDASILFSPLSGIEDVSMNGHAVPKTPPRVLQFLNGWHAYDCPVMPTEGIELQFTIGGDKPAEAYVVDESYDLPAAGETLRKARPGYAVASQDGDVTLVYRRLKIPAGAAATAGTQ